MPNLILNIHNNILKTLPILVISLDIHNFICKHFILYTKRQQISIACKVTCKFHNTVAPGSINNSGLAVAMQYQTRAQPVKKRLRSHSSFTAHISHAHSNN